MDHAALVGIVDGPALGLELHLRAMPVGSGQHGAAAIAASDELGREMGDGHGRKRSLRRTNMRFVGIGLPIRGGKQDVAPATYYCALGNRSFGTAG
ncbi:hypothetical protein GCM10007857_43240 [Bradyrhizobium iriomotense]|uniref:Uncharacterized protein n=1 Tax=Bradyrhizobium iriomotense TaxID=441950 RepID=A0ABQ6B0C7_9BRAD|nr:hypothetical protein GCM10007857_43240 [Bradyrhizobium iriomotense]